MRRIVFAALALVALAAGILLYLASGSPAPVPVTTGPRLAAVKAASFRDSPAPARQAEFSADGRWLVTASVSGAVAIRALPDLKPVRRFEHPGGATSFVLAPDRSWLATAGYDGVIRIWDVASGRPLRALKGAESTIWTLDLSPDGRTLAAAGEDKTIRLWDVASGRLLRALRGNERNVWEARFSPDGRRLASVGFDKTVRLWDAATGAPLATLRDHEEGVVGLDWSPDGRWLASGGDDETIRIRRSEDGRTVRILRVGNHAWKLGFSADSAWIANAGRARSALGTFWHGLVGGGGGVATIRLWRVSDGALVAALPSSEDVDHVAFSPDGHYLVSTAEDGLVTLWGLHLVA
ncbi:MAG: WD40 repeat domain-containing protein [Allosphingosinicella sp.]